MKKEHLASVLRIEKECFRDPYDERFLEKLTGTESARSVVALLDGQVCGYALAHVTEVYDLLRICVVSDLRQKGMGREIMRSFADRPVALEVSVRNEDALAFYKRIGFSLAHVRKGYYGPEEDGLVCIRPKL